MNRREVRVSDGVKLQIREQVLYIARDSIDNALAWEDRLRAATNALSDFSGHAIDEEASHRVGATVRKLIFEKTYLVRYQVSDIAAVVEVVNFRHGSRLPKIGEP